MVVIILCHNQREYNDGLAKSILRASDNRDGVKFVWVNNGSTDLESVEHLKTVCTDNGWIYWGNDENKLFTLAVAEVINAYPAEDIYLLNNDIIVKDGWLSGREALGEWGLIAATQIHPFEETFYTFAGGRDDYAGHKVGFTWRNETGIHEETWVTFGACMINRTAYDSVGGMDLNLRFYCSDSDLSLRMRDAGFKVGVSWDMKVVHFGGVTTNERREMSVEGREDQILFAEKHGLKAFGLDFTPYDVLGREEWFKDFFTTYKQTEERNKVVSKRLADMLDREFFVKNKNVLELGCAWGNVVKSLRDKGAVAEGYDIAGVSAYDYVYKELPEKADYDLIFSQAFLEHVPENETVHLIEEMFKKLKAGGWCYHEIDTKAGIDKSHINIHQPEWWDNVFKAVGFEWVKAEMYKTGMYKVTYRRK